MLSWLLEHILSSIPEWLWLVGAGAGLVVYFFTGIMSHFPGISAYAKFFKPVAGITTLLCVFMYGGAGVQAMWEEKIRLAQEEADKKAAMAQQLNEDLDKERKKKSQIRVEYRDRIKTEIRIQKDIIDKDCKIDPKVPEILNKAATNPTGESK